MDFKTFLKENLQKDIEVIEILSSDDYDHQRTFKHHLVRLKCGNDVLGLVCMDLIICDYQAMQMQVVKFKNNDKRPVRLTEHPNDIV